MIYRTQNQSIMLSLPSNQSANHAILNFQPTAWIQFLLQYIILDPMDAYKKNSFPAVMQSTLPQKGVAFFPPPQMPVPPSGPSKKHNSVPKLRFIPATVVYGSKRRVPSGVNPLHN
ncbi:LOW QUALITY PROTEIN: putative mitochondrial protein AtMg00170/AtMg00620 [Nicotiana tabacum]|uniref:LOW QUALITY PROTEIN: putative mitochondrial protein AtMg00170/AtMg00620 n=1 Tax=Nicotiana tabacum TaxID=4097 RepID=A0AC58TG13_TOBAC